MEQWVNDFADILWHIGYMLVQSHHLCMDIVQWSDCRSYLLPPLDDSHKLKEKDLVRPLYD